MEQTLRQLKRAPEVVKKRAADVVGVLSVRVAQRARNLVAVHTGELRRAIDWTHREGALTGGVGVDSSSPASRYWYFVEMGTVNMAAQPFFRPAAEASESEFVRDMRGIGPEIERDLGE